MDWEAFYGNVFGGKIGTLAGGNPTADFGMNISKVLNIGTDTRGVGPTISQSAAASGKPNFVDDNGVLNIQVGGADKPGKVGADNGMPWAIDWWGDGSAVTGNPGLVDKEEVQPGHGFGAPGALLEGIESTFARIAIIILGFIFVAVGLSMFKNNPGVVTKVVAAAV